MSESQQLENTKTATQELTRETPIVDFSAFPRLPEGSEKVVCEQMKRVLEIYQSSPDITLRMQITEDAFNRLQNQEGIKGDGYSRLKEVIADGKPEYYLVVSPYTNVEQVRGSEDTKQEALTLDTSHFSTKTDDETVNFELAKITAEGVSEIKDRSEIYPHDLLRIEPIEKDQAERFIRLAKNAEAEKEKFEKQPLTYRLLRKIMSPERASEFLVGFTMMQLEIAHDMQLYPAKYRMTQDQAGRYLIPQEPPMAKWAMDHIGDIWEISAGTIALRTGFVALNEVLKKTTGKEISDDACFWASLITTTTIKSVHSLGYISLFGIHDHMDNPVPEMLFGQGVAVVVLAATHYAAKHRESIKDLSIRTAKFTGKKFKQFDTMMNNLGRPTVSPDVIVNTDEQNEK